MAAHRRSRALLLVDALLISATLGSALEPRSDHAASGCRNTVQVEFGLPLTMTCPRLSLEKNKGSFEPLAK